MYNFQKILFIIFIPILLTACQQQEQQTSQTKNLNMKITSTAFEHNQNIPAKYTCDGENVNPPLTILDVPENTQSLVLISDDPDAPSGDWVHWLIWNINPQTKEIAENSIPQNSVQGTTSFGKSSYGGPCPPSGTHRYFFKIFALDIKIKLDSEAQKSQLEAAIKNHILASAELIGLYSRQ